MIPITVTKNQLPKSANYLGSDWENSFEFDAVLARQIDEADKAKMAIFVVKVQHPEQWEKQYFSDAT